MQVKTRDEFLSAVMQLLAESPETNVMVIVDSDAGPGVLQTHPSYIWSFGLLGAAEKMLDAEYQALKDRESQKRFAALKD